MTFDFQVSGFKEIEAQLLALEDVFMARLAMRRAALKAFAGMAEDARRRVAAKTGALRDSIRLAIVVPETGDAVMSVGIKMTDQKLAFEVEDDGGSLSKLRVRYGGGWRWHFEEKGTRPHMIGQSRLKIFQLLPLHRAIRAVTGRNMKRKESQEIKRAIVASREYQAQRIERGHPGTAARPFLRPAWDANIMEALEIFRVELRKEISKAIERKTAGAA